MLLVCPLCHGTLESAPQAYRCSPCARQYPVLCGIPDFRVLPDRYISIEDDRRNGRRLFEAAAGRSFEGMLDLYWSLTPEVAPALAAKFKAHQLAEAEIARVTLQELPSAGGALLDVGCSTGGFLIAASGRFPTVVGIDVAFRWLVVGLVRLRDAGVHATLLCANAEHLPFPEGSFAAVTANDLLEHVVEPRAAMAECHRVSQVGGSAYFSTNNRYSLLPEPHVGVWGVGWLPRPLQADYVRMAAGLPYRNISLGSGAELRAWSRAAGFAAARLRPAPPSSSPARLPRAQRWYNALRRSPLGERLLTRWGPRLQLLCRK